MLKNEIEAMVGDLASMFKPKSGAESKNGDKDTARGKKQTKGDVEVTSPKASKKNSSKKSNKESEKDSHN